MELVKFVVAKIADALNDAGKPLKGSRVLILGVAYKADVGDPSTGSGQACGSRRRWT